MPGHKYAKFYNIHKNIKNVIRPVIKQKHMVVLKNTAIISKTTNSTNIKIFNNSGCNCAKAGCFESFENTELLIENEYIYEDKPIEEENGRRPLKESCAFDESSSLNELFIDIRFKKYEKRLIKILADYYRKNSVNVSTNTTESREELLADYETKLRQKLNSCDCLLCELIRKTPIETKVIPVINSSTIEELSYHPYQE